MGWEFPAILGGALVVSLLLGLWQQARYARSVNAMVKQHHGKGRAHPPRDRDVRFRHG